MANTQQIIETIPDSYRGPGGAVAVLKDGEVIGQHVWGYADMDQRIPMSSQTQMPICSITKQMLCAVISDLEQNPTPTIAANGNFREQLSKEFENLMPVELASGEKLTIDHLCDNQSGIRDYWALAMLWGARPDGRFTVSEDGKNMLPYIKKLHFPPGAEFSYSNTNFHLLGRLVEKVSKEDLGDLLSQRVFGPAEMKTASLRPDTANPPPPCIGYEGNQEHGFVPAYNAIEWSGDAGVVASLEDMIAYERYFARCWSDPQSLYRVVAENRVYSDGTSARYRHGLIHMNVGPHPTIGHGGALRGYRLHRLYVPEEHLSIVVMFNHEADAGDAAEKIMRKILEVPESPLVSHHDPAEWVGSFLDQGTQLLVTVTASPTNSAKIFISYAWGPEEVQLTAPNRGASRDNIALLEGDLLQVERVRDHRRLKAKRIDSPQTKSGDTLVGVYRSDEMDTTFHCEGRGLMVYGAFDGPLGRGPAHLMRQIGEDVWALSCPRGLDAPAPGDWTMVVSRDEHGSVQGFTIGCWLARLIQFRRIK